MPEYDENDEIEPEEPEGVRGIRQAKKAAEERAKAAEEALAAADADRRELAALKAGLDPADKTAAFFLSHYDGDLTAEAMKTAAIEAGVLPEIDAEAQASVDGQAQMASAFQGGEHTPLGTTFVGDAGQRIQVPADEAEKWQEFQAALNRGENGMDVLRRYDHPLSGNESGDYQFHPGYGAANTTPRSGRP